ncbi:MAG: TonB-dependent receptor [Bacteroidales bacterium]|nr:TonB-dependent receptor [Bacteroidales bacterium]MDT8432752.1 TonB-dependent receptor [Bacteroidales bacterium]
MKKLSFLFLFISQLTFAQRYTISGYIEDAGSSERLPGASVYNLANTNLGTASNEYGFYSLTIPAGKIKLTCTYVGYTSVIKEMILSADTIINIKLTPSLEIDEVSITSKRDHVRDNQTGFIEVPLNVVRNLPVILGEADIMKSIQMMPGIKGGVEGTSGIYVRGGSPDQNQILIDGVPVYNINHLFGFFSVFNSDAISDFDVIKGGFPARYGGHLSSVIDVRMKEGNMQESNTSFNIGLLSSSVMTEGPLIKDKCSYMISARRSYLDLIAVPAEWIYSLISPDIDRLTAGYFMEDLNAKINYKFSDKDRVYFSLYYGRDNLYANIGEDYSDSASYRQKYKMNWGNMVTALRWNHVFSPKLFANTSLSYSRFQYFIGQEEKDIYMWNGGKYTFNSEASYNTSIRDLAVNMDFNYILSPSYNIKFGANGIYHMFNPGISASKISEGADVAIDTSYGNSLIAAKEYAIYLENNMNIGKFLSLNIGGRLANFQIRDTTFISPEPRISVRALITDNFSLKASYSKMKQFVNLLTSTTVGFPTDIWIPSTDIVLPQNSTQYAVSANFNFANTYDLTIEGYYKDMNNLVEYKEGANLFLDFDNTEVKDADMWESKVTQGIGWSYGVEFLLRKDIGKLKGWAGYTLSWANRRFDEIDNGEVFPFTYDRRHDIAIALTYKFSDRYDFGMNWVFNTGNAITLATANYMSHVDLQNFNAAIERLEGEIPGYHQSTEYYENRNNFRMPSYHRLDLGVNMHKQKKRGTRTLTLGLYNAYFHMNPFMIEVKTNYFSDDQTNKSVYAYGLFPIIPSIAYHFKFE